MPLDRLSAQLDIKTVDYGQRIISGFAAAGGLDRVGDVIDMSVAFRKTLAEKQPSDVAVFVGHDQSSLPVGIPISIEATPQGLKTETRIFDGPAGDNLLSVARGLMQHGQMLGLSIGYRVTDASPDRVNGKSVRRLTGIDLIEYSFAARQAIANPRALVTGVKALSEGSDTAGGFTVPPDDEGKAMKPTVEKRGDRFHVVGADGQSMGSYDTEAAARAACDMHGSGGGKGKTWDAPYVNSLPDSAFLVIEPGGRVDDESKTVPRSLRHFPIRDDAGALDPVQVKLAIDGIPKAGDWLDAQARPRLAARARTLLGGGDEKTGAALDISSFAYRLLDLSDALAEEHKAMALLGEDTKDGTRIRAAMRQKVAAVVKDIQTALTWAELADKGEDGKARLALLSREFELLEV